MEIPAWKVADLPEGVTGGTIVTSLQQWFRYHCFFFVGSSLYFFVEYDFVFLLEVIWWTEYWRPEESYLSLEQGLLTWENGCTNYWLNKIRVNKYFSLVKVTGRFLDPISLDNFLWECLKSKVYVNRPHNIHYFKDKIRTEITLEMFSTINWRTFALWLSTVRYLATFSSWKLYISIIFKILMTKLHYFL